jgi:hypothetical protein
MECGTCCARILFRNGYWAVTGEIVDRYDVGPRHFDYKQVEYSLKVRKTQTTTITTYVKNRGFLRHPKKVAERPETEWKVGEYDIQVVEPSFLFILTIPNSDIFRQRVRRRFTITVDRITMNISDEARAEFDSVF